MRGNALSRLGVAAAALLTVAATLTVSTACSSNKCGGGAAAVAAKYDSTTRSLTDCRGITGVPSTSEPTPDYGKLDVIELHVGESIGIVRGDPNLGTFSQLASSDTSVLKLTRGAEGDSLGTFVAVGAGNAAIRAIANVCGGVAGTAVPCDIAFLRVTG